MGDGATIIETSVLKITPRTSTYNFPRIPTGRNEREDKTIRKEFVRFFFFPFFFLKIFECFFFLFVFLLEVGDMAKQYIEKGLLVPDHVITRVMMSELENRRGQHWLLDGELNPRVS